MPRGFIGILHVLGAEYVERRHPVTSFYDISLLGKCKFCVWNAKNDSDYQFVLAMHRKQGGKGLGLLEIRGQKCLNKGIFLDGCVCGFFGEWRHKFLLIQEFANLF